MTEECRWGVILDDYMTTHCSDCLTLCLTPVPCPTCHLVVFCNEDCRARGWSRFHSRECPVLPTLKALDLEMHIIMAVKNVITASFVTMKEEMPPILRDRAQGRVRVPLGEESFDPAAFRNLILSDNRTANPEKKEFLAYCIAAVLMTKILQESGHFFVDRDGHAFEPSDDDLQMTGMAIYLLLLTSLVRANVFSFDERINGGQKSAIHFSAGIFPTICMTKQSCNPSTVLYRCGPAVVLRAVGPIAAGEPITTMSSHYGHTTLAARQKAFSELGIQCDCVACVEEWPIYENLPEGFSLKCPKCSHPLRRVGGTVRCEHHAVGLPARPGEDSCWGGCLRRLSGGRRKAVVGEDMDEMRSLYSVVERFEARWKFMRKGEETDEDLRLMAEATEVLEKHGVLPSKLYHDAKIRLTTCYATRELDLP